jgi:hypothetical protein
MRPITGLGLVDHLFLAWLPPVARHVHFGKRSEKKMSLSLFSGTAVVFLQSIADFKMNELKQDGREGFKATRHY